MWYDVWDVLSKSFLAGVGFGSGAGLVVLVGLSLIRAAREALVSRGAQHAAPHS
jgi:hypothetical protein